MYSVYPETTPIPCEIITIESVRDMETQPPKKITRFFVGLMLIGAALAIVTYLAVSLARIRYPFELEWMEGAMVDHVRRVLAGQMLYVRPSLTFIPFIYTPLYFYLSALASKILGVGFFPLRLVSFLASLGSFALLYALAYRETRRPALSILAPGLFAATYQASGAWFDIARVDSLMIFCLLTAIYLLRVGTRSALVVAGIALTLAYLTKQSTLVIAVPLLASTLYLFRARACYFALPFVILTGASTIWLNHLTHGWFNYYIFDLPGQHAMLHRMYLGFWVYDLWAVLPVALIFCLYYLPIAWQADRRSAIFFIALAAGMLGGSWFSRLHAGGDLNVLFPAFACLSLLFPMALPALDASLRRHLPQRQIYVLALYVLGVAQFLILIYQPLKLIPSHRDEVDGQRLIAHVQQIPGDVLILSHGYLPTMAGKSSHAHLMAIVDILRAKNRPLKMSVRRELDQAIISKRYSAIILDDTDIFRSTRLCSLKSSLAGSYTLHEILFKNPKEFRPITGLPTRPEFLYLRKP